MMGGHYVLGRVEVFLTFCGQSRNSALGTALRLTDGDRLLLLGLVVDGEKVQD